MLSRMEIIARKSQWLKQLDPKHEVEVERTFEEYLAAAIRATDPKVIRQKMAEATEAYEGALDGALYEVLDNHSGQSFAAEDSTVA